MTPKRVTFFIAEGLVLSDNNWASKAISIIDKFDAFIIPLLKSNKPAAKVNLDKWLSHPEYDPSYNVPTQNANTLNKWAKTFPGYGVVPRDKFIVIDVDVKEGQNGRNSLIFLSNNGLDIQTFAVKTPSGGLHLYFKPPHHYIPSAAVGTRVLFENALVQSEWDELQKDAPSSGIDVRWGWSYVVGPGSNFPEKGLYSIRQNLPLKSIPTSISIGVRKVVNKTLKVADKSEDPLQFGSLITHGRNNHALQYTFRLFNMPGLLRDEALVLIREMQKWYDTNPSLGSPPSYDEMVSMYDRSGEKISKDIESILSKCVYVKDNATVYETESMSSYPVDAFRIYMKQFMVTVPSDNGKDKRINPIDLFLENPDRPTVESLIYDSSEPSGIITLPDGNKYFNTFIKRVIPDAEKTEVGFLIFEAFEWLLNNVLTNPQDRLWFKRWVAVLIFDLKYRPSWSFYIHSNVRGVGKDLLASVVEQLYGKSNTFRADTTLFTDQFNADLFRYGLCILSDFTSVSRNKYDQVNSSFKRISGSDSGRCRDLYVRGKQNPLSVRFLMLANSEMDFPVDSGDRRIYIARSEGTSLNPNRGGTEYSQRVAILIGCLVNLERMSPQLIESAGLVVTQADVDSAMCMIRDMLFEVDWKIMYKYRDCPYTEYKSEIESSNEPRFVKIFREHVEHRLRVVKSDIVTKNSLEVFLKCINCNTDIDTVVSMLKRLGLITPVYLTLDTSSRAQPTVPMLAYDEDTDMLIAIGEPKRCSGAYYVRNPDRWGATVKVNVKDVALEYMKYVGISGMSITQKVRGKVVDLHG